MDYKPCSKCGEHKPVSAFYMHKRRSGNSLIPYPHCKACALKYQKAYYQCHIDRVKDYHKVYNREHGQEQYSAHRKERIANAIEYAKKNRGRVLAYNRQYRKEHPELVRKWRKVDYDKRGEWYKEYSRLYGPLYRKANKDKIRDREAHFKTAWKLRTGKSYNGYYGMRRRHSDPAFKIRSNLSTRLYIALRDSKLGRLSKSTLTLKLLGCTVQQLMQWLEAKFQPGMSWDNYGKWHVDHIRPCASFDLLNPEEQRACFHFSNLQPLWATDNIRKSCKTA